MKKIRGLGRGLDALLGGDESSGDQLALQTVAVTQLSPGKYQPRTHMDQESLNALADSIRHQGIMQPILVRVLQADQFEIIAGERRWRAATIAGLTEVPVLVKTVADEAVLAMALIENIQREDLNPLEEANGLQRLIDEFGMTHQSAAEAVGRSRSAVSNLLRLLQLPQTVQQLMMAGQIDMGHARAMLALPANTQMAVAEQVAQRQMSVRETESWIKRLLNPVEAKLAPKPDRDVMNLVEKFADKLGAKVSLHSKKTGAGKLVIEYDNLEQLDDIMSKF
ncbi:MAG: ParB/RepB/Spo0J family partition protein [Betaproteobacteria bacterium]|nr:ParB/RepB/Spo0J family partition protein [Betaproteobacteria bacterium]